MKAVATVRTNIPVMTDVRGLIFDCDGTLVDSMPIHLSAWMETFVHFGEVCPPEFLPQYNGMPSRQIIAIFNAKFGRSIDPTEFAIEKDKRVEGPLRKVKPIEAVTAIVKNYRGKVPMAVASGGKRKSVIRSLDAIGMRDWFDAIVTADDPVAGKPEPDIFLEAARRIGVEPAGCQVFEDGDMGIEAAKRAGISVVDVREYL